MRTIPERNGPGRGLIFMKKSWLVLLFALSLLAGCAQNYVITTRNGDRISTTSKPKLKDGSYVYKDRQGQPGSIPSGRVREIAPASAGDEKKMQFIPP
jgi:hypothetical protein